MKAPIRISDELGLPLDVVTSTLVVYGSKGMGKTVFGATLAEELAARGLRWAWLDPLGVGWGIRHSADGAGKGVECLILGGVHGDIPIEPTGGAAVADVVVEESVNVLIDFSRKPSGEMWGVGEKIRFVDAYTRRLFQRQGDLVGGRRREPMLQILDEAARYIPQTIPHGSPDLAKCVAAWQQLVEEGRNVGIGVCLLTQRSARISKDVAELADAMVAFRTIGPNSLGAVLDWLGEHVEKSRIKALSEQVRELPRGSALVVSPGWLKVERVVPIRMRETFDSSATPKPGERPRTARGEGAKPDLEKIRARMAATIERAKAEDPKELQREIAALKRRCAELERAPSEEAVQDSYAEGEEAGRRESAAALRAAGDRFRELAAEGARRMQIAARMLGEVFDHAAFEKLEQHLREGWGVEIPAPPQRALPPERLERKAPVRPAAAPRTASVPPARRAREAGAPPTEGLTGPEQRILDALAELEELGTFQPPRMQVALFAGYTHLNSKGFTNGMGALRSAGRIDYPLSGTLALTDAGRALARSNGAPRSSAEIQERVLALLGGPCARVLEPLLQAYPKSMARDELVLAAGYTHANSKGFTNTIGRMRSLGLIEYPSTGQVGASDVLFLERR